MVPITHKSNTLRKAIAQAIVRVSKPETILAIRDRTVPKGDVLECARVAGLFVRGEAHRRHDSGLPPLAHRIHRGVLHPW